MKRLIILLFIQFIGIQLFAQNQITQSIRGQIRDKETQEAIQGVNVVVLNTTPLKVAQSDIEGKFKLDKISVGRLDLKVSAIGYEDLLLNGLLLGSGKELILNIELKERFINSPEVEIIADKNQSNNEMATVSARSFSVEESKRYAASVNDPARMALSYAGVANNGDFDNGIVIRGNAPRGLLWRLDGVEIPNPNHFSTMGSSGGSISMMSANTMSNSDFYVGAFPADYGNALSGVFDIKLRNGNDQKREYAVQFGLLGADVSAEGPIAKTKSSYLINYRYSTLAMLNGIGIKISGDAVPIFQDLTWKVNLPTKKAGTFTFFGLRGANEVAQTDTDFKFTNQESLLTTGLSHLYLFNNNRTYIKSIVSYSNTNGVDDENEADVNNVFYKTFSQNSNEDFYRFSSFVNHKLNVQHTFRAGIIVTQMNFDVNISFFDRDINAFKKYYDDKGNTQYYQSFIQYKYKPKENITITSGLHTNFFALNNTYSIEPRLGFQYDVNPRNSFTAGLGVHSRIESIGLYFTNVYDANTNTYSQPNKDLESSKALHFVTGYRYQLNEFSHLKVESYYQHLYDIPVGVDSGSTFSLINFDWGMSDLTLENNGTGTNYGIELSLERPLKNNLYYLITLSLFNSTYENNEGKKFNTRYNNNYLFNVLIGKEIKLKNQNFIGFNIRSIIAGGLRNTPIDLNASIIKGSAVYLTDQAYTKRNPLYFRPDLRVNYKINKKNVSHEISLDIQNVINRANVFSEYFDRKKLEVQTSYQLGLIPILNYRIEF